jgi:IMP dehydrogenase
MGYQFSWSEILDRSRGLTFDDVLLIPQLSQVRSRRDPELSSRLTRNVKIDIPIVSANMDTLTEAPMAIAMQKLGAFGILHRFMSISDQARQVRLVREAGFDNAAASVGVNTDEKERAEELVRAGATILTIDIAHGHSVAMIETVKYLKDRFPKVDVIAGNVATPEATRDLISAGADAVKVGIGPGSMCTTRIITGCGVPQLTAIALCALAAEDSKTPIIADGGMKTSGDILKAIAAGASSVMLGSMLSGTLETPGEIKSGQKQYRGMASKQAQISWRGGVPEGMAAEGEATLVPIKGPVKLVIDEICGGIRSGMSYINAVEVSEIREKARFIEMSAAGVNESHAHGLWTYSARRPI